MAGTEDALTCTLDAVLTDGSDGELRQLLYGLFAVSRTLDAIRERLGARIGVSGFQFHILTALNDLKYSEPVGIKQLAAHLRVAPPNVTVEVAKLVRKGLLSKRRNAADGRAVDIALTAAGRRAIARILPDLRALNDEMFAGIDGKTFRAALAAVTRIDANGKHQAAGSQPAAADTTPD